VKLVVGNKQKEIDRIPEFNRVEIDLGTGDGRFVYKKALENPNTLFIGIDPSQKQLQIYSKKANRKKLDNTLFVIGSIEILPPELKNCADKLNIILPWGSLLESIVKPTKNTISKLLGLLKKDGEIEMIFGYDPNFDVKASIPEINLEYVESTIIPAFSEMGICTLEIPKDLDTTWSKKLKSSKKRELFKLNIKNIKE